MTDDQYKEISKVCVDQKIDGIIIGGCLPTDLKNAQGGVGGEVIKEYANNALKMVSKYTKELQPDKSKQIPLISQGGIFTGKDVQE